MAYPREADVAAIGAAGAVVSSVDPRTGLATASDARMTHPSDVPAIVSAAADTASALVALGREGRAKLLDVLAAELEGDAQELVAVCHRETGLPRARLKGELSRTAAQLRFMGEVIRDGGYLDLTVDHAKTVGESRVPDVRLMKVPIGVVAVFAASNFPFAFSVAGGDVASAIAAGCPVMIKAHTSHPQTSVRTLAAVHRGLAAMGLDTATVGAIFGREAGIALAVDPPIRAIGFTGSVGGGRQIAKLATERDEPIPFFGELGSVNPFVVTPAAAAARPEEIAAALVGSLVLGAGQFCTKPGLVFVPEGSAGDILLEAARSATAATIAGHSLNQNIFETYIRESESLAATEGLRVTTGEVAETGFAVQAMLVEVESAELTVELVTERFGPVAIVARYSSMKELSSTLRDLPGALVGTVHGEEEGDSVAEAALALLAARCGRLVWNGVPTGVVATWAMNHGGPWPSAYGSTFSSVGAAAIDRWLRPIAWQDVPDSLLPTELSEGHSDCARRVDGRLRHGSSNGLDK